MFNLSIVYTLNRLINLVPNYRFPVPRFQLMFNELTKLNLRKLFDEREAIGTSKARSSG